ncbi:MAG: hypothetical protein ACI8WT_003806 [Clostridium sp.]|jgi:hypothetical protein
MLKTTMHKIRHLYLASAISKFSILKFNYENKAGWARLSKEKIILPVNSEGHIKFQLMEDYIKVTQKKVFNNLYKNITYI